MSADNQDEKIKGWVSKALNAMESEKPAFHQAALPVVEKTWAAHPKLAEKFGTPNDFLKKVAEDSMLQTVGLLPDNRAIMQATGELIQTLSNNEILINAQITGKEPPIADGVTYSGLQYAMTNFSESAGNYFYRGKRHEFIDADRAELAAKFKVGANDSGMGRGAGSKSENS